jgi:Ser/Thr protein kinase RdoA (MazF antagonist)
MTVPGSRAVVQHSARGLGPALRRIGRETAAAEAADVIAEFLAEEGNKARFGRCHGDFMPLNVIVADGGERSTPELTVIDWEWTKWGNGAFDVGLFAGEAWLLQYFRGKPRAKGLLEPFLKAYASERELTDEERWKAAARFAVQITYWPITGKWGRDRIEEVMEIAVDVLQQVARRDTEWLKGSMLGLLFKDLD